MSTRTDILEIPYLNMLCLISACWSEIRKILVRHKSKFTDPVIKKKANLGLSSRISVVVTYNIFLFDCQITPTYFSESETGTKKRVSQRERVPHRKRTLCLAEDWSQIAGSRRRRLCVIPPVASMSCLLRNR